MTVESIRFEAEERVSRALKVSHLNQRIVRLSSIQREIFNEIVAQEIVVHDLL